MLDAFSVASCLLSTKSLIERLQTAVTGETCYRELFEEQLLEQLTQADEAQHQQERPCDVRHDQHDQSLSPFNLNR